MFSRDGKAIGAKAIALAAALSFGQPANANDLTNFLRDYFGIGPSHYSDRFAQHHTLSNLDNLRVQISARIDEAEARGRITAQQAAELRDKKDRNRDLSARYARDGRLSFAEAQTLWASLNNLDADLQYAITSNVATNPAYDSNERLYRMRERLQNRLDRGRADGRLTLGEYRTLKQQLDRLTARQARMERTGDFLSRGEYQQLLSEMRRLDSQISQNMHDRQFAGRYGRYWY